MASEDPRVSFDAALNAAIRDPNWWAECFPQWTWKGPRHSDIRPGYAVVYRDGEFHRAYGAFTWEIVPRGGATLVEIVSLARKTEMIARCGHYVGACQCHRCLCGPCAREIGKVGVHARDFE